MTRISELYLLVIGTIALSFIGIGAIVYISYVRPTADNMQLDVMICGFLAPTIFTFANFVKGYQIQTKQEQNSQGIADIKKSTDGMTTQLVDSATTVATLTAQVAASKTAADLAAITATNTAIALAAKVDSTKEAVVENGTHSH